METQEELITRAKSEIRLNEESVIRNRKRARKSFKIWLNATIEKVCRAFGYKIIITFKSLNKITDWLYE